MNPLTTPPTEAGVTDILPLKEFVDIPFFSTVEWAIIFFIILFILFKIIKLLWKSRVLLSTTKEEEPIFSEISFLDRVLELEKYIKDGLHKDFSHNATDIFKKYLSFQKNLNITDWTTKELLVIFKDENTQIFVMIREVFFILDPVKFADKNGTEDESTRAYEIIKKYIKEEEVKREELISQLQKTLETTTNVK